jgi:hypothetical protein
LQKTLGPEERAFFHAVPGHDGRLTVTTGYCWGSASGTFDVRDGQSGVVGELTIRGY